jgi:DNA-binding NarL/FixJ family response regulator
MGAMDRGASTLESCASRRPGTKPARRLVVLADNSLIITAIQIGFHQSDEFELVGSADPRKTSASTILRAQPDAILFDDLGQPAPTLELLREIREQDEEIIVLMLTVSLESACLDQLFSAGASAVISKATTPPALVTLVRETLNGNIVHRPPPAAQVAGADATLEVSESPLTGRETEILRLLASGSTNGEIARRLWVTERTVKFHLRNIYPKLGVANRTQASHLAHIRGLVSSVPGPDPDGEHKLSAVS